MLGVFRRWGRRRGCPFNLCIDKGPNGVHHGVARFDDVHQAHPKREFAAQEHTKSKLILAGVPAVRRDTRITEAIPCNGVLVVTAGDVRGRKAIVLEAQSLIERGISNVQPLRKAGEQKE